MSPVQWCIPPPDWQRASPPAPCQHDDTGGGGSMLDQRPEQRAPVSSIGVVPPGHGSTAEAARER